MFVFVSPVRHPNNAHSYSRVEELLKHTAASITNSTSDQYRYIVVCCQAPQNCESHPNVEYHVVDFPPPGEGRAGSVSIEAVRRDKGVKILAGIMKAREYGAEYIMIADADDFVHRDLVAFCSENSGCNGWYVDKGLMYRDGGAVIGDLDDFNSFCGTSVILNMKLIEPFIDPSLTPRSSESEIFDKTDEEFLTFILGSHRPVVEFFEKRGQPLAPLPFRAAVWLTDSGESHSTIKFNRLPRIVSGAEIEEFGLPVEMNSVKWMTAAVTELPAYWAKHFLKTYVLKKA